MKWVLPIVVMLTVPAHVSSFDGRQERGFPFVHFRGMGVDPLRWSRGSGEIGSRRAIQAAFRKWSWTRAGIPNLPSGCNRSGYHSPHFPALQPTGVDGRFTTLSVSSAAIRCVNHSSAVSGTNPPTGPVTET